MESFLHGWSKRILRVCQCAVVLDQQIKFRELHIWGTLRGVQSVNQLSVLHPHWLV